MAEYPDPDDNGTIVATQHNVYDATSQINRTKLFFKLPSQTEEVIEELNSRMYFSQELNALLEENGFIIEYKFGDYEETPFISSAKLQLLVCSTWFAQQGSDRLLFSGCFLGSPCPTLQKA